MKRALALLALAGCGSRTEVVFGIATDLPAPDSVDLVTFEVTRQGTAVPQFRVEWPITGNSDPFNLPGSFGVFSDGEEFSVEAKLTAFNGANLVLERKSIVSLIEGETLFYRMGLTAGCIDRLDCPDGTQCVESVCRDINVPSNQLPSFTDRLPFELTCVSAVTYKETETGDDMDVADNAGDCPAGQCLEGTCLKPPPAGGGTREVRGSQVASFVLPDNQLEQVELDLSAIEIAAIVTDGGGNTQVFPGTGRNDGTFSIPDVPGGIYTLKLGISFFVTSADFIDLGFLVLGRPNKIPVTDFANTGINFNVTGMSAWADGNILTAYAPTANAWWFFFNEDPATTPTINDTALANVAVTYQNRGTAGLDLVQNDTFALLQYTNNTELDSGITYQTVTKMLVANPPINMTDGALAQVSGVFADVPLTETVSLDVRQTDWELAVGWNGTNPTLLNPTAVPIAFGAFGVTGSDGGVSMDLFGQPGGGPYGQFSATLDYFFVSVPEGSNTFLTDLTFSKPHISTYEFTPILTASIVYQVLYQLPGTNNPTSFFVAIRTDRLADSDLFVVTPALGPVRDVQVDGRDFFADQQGVPANARITWSAPALGSASMYTVDIYRLGVSAPNNTNQTRVAFVRTTNRFLDAPPGVFEPGQSYVVIVSSSLDGNIDAPFRGRLPEAFAGVASGIITVGGP